MIQDLVSTMLYILDLKATGYPVQGHCQGPGSHVTLPCPGNGQTVTKQTQALAPDPVPGHIVSGDTLCPIFLRLLMWTVITDDSH